MQCRILLRFLGEGLKKDLSLVHLNDRKGISHILFACVQSLVIPYFIHHIVTDTDTTCTLTDTRNESKSTNS